MNLIIVDRLSARFICAPSVALTFLTRPNYSRHQSLWQRCVATALPALKRRQVSFLPTASFPLVGDKKQNKKKSTVFVVLLYGRFKKSVSVFYVVRTIFFSVHLVLSPYVFPCLCIVFRTFKIYILFSFYKSRSRNEKVHNFCTFCCQNRKLNASNFFPMPCPRAWLWWVIPTPQLLKGISTLFSAPTERFWSLMIKWEYYDSVFIT